MKCGGMYAETGTRNLLKQCRRNQAAAVAIKSGVLPLMVSSGLQESEERFSVCTTLQLRLLCLVVHSLAPHRPGMEVFNNSPVRGVGVGRLGAKALCSSVINAATAGTQGDLQHASFLLSPPAGA